MNLLDIVLYFLAGAGGAAINSVAGGGTFLTFPVLILSGMGPLQANIVNTIALWPGVVTSAYAYRNQRMAEWRRLMPFLAACLLGGTAGAFILLGTPERVFNQMVPWLLLFATLLFTFGKYILFPSSQTTRHEPRITAIVWLFLFLTAIYGGYFGAGIGIVILAMLQVLGFSDIHRMNALKTLMAGAINAAAVVIFLFSGKVVWPVAGVMIVGAMCGGYVGASIALKVSPQKVRLLVSCIGFSMTAYFFLYGG